MHCSYWTVHVLRCGQTGDLFLEVGWRRASIRTTRKRQKICRCPDALALLASEKNCCFIFGPSCGSCLELTEGRTLNLKTLLGGCKRCDPSARMHSQACAAEMTAQYASAKKGGSDLRPHPGHRSLVRIRASDPGLSSSLGT